MPSTEMLSNLNDAAGMEDCHGNMDDLVEDINEEWVNNFEAHGDRFIDADCIPYNFTKNVTVAQGKQAEAVKRQQDPTTSDVVKSTENASKHNGNCVDGTGSIKEGKKKALQSISSSKSKHIKKKKEGVILKHTAGFVKKIACLPLSDRKEILKVLKKQECKRSVLAKASKMMTTSLSNSSNTSNAFVNRRQWAVLHDKKETVAEDVREIGKTLGVNFDSGKKCGFNLLTREGRKEFRAGRGSMLEEGDVQEGGSVKEGV